MEQEVEELTLRSNLSAHECYALCQAGKCRALVVARQSDLAAGRLLADENTMPPLMLTIKSFNGRDGGRSRHCVPTAVLDGEVV